MTTATRRRPSRPSTPPEPPAIGRSRAVTVTVGALVVAVAVIVIIALLAGGSDESSESSAAESAHIPTTGTLRQVSFVEGAGDPLPKYAAAAVDDAAVGMTAPTITASHFDNSEVTIDFADGTPRLVMFFAHWCPHCQAEVTGLTSRIEAGALGDDAEILAISTAVDQGGPNYPPSSWFINEGWPLPVLRDSETGELAAMFGLSGYPFAVAVDGNGTVVARTSGQIPEAQFDALLERAASGMSPAASG